jgi:tRNA nucleotidyltransferase (CCA-adding enzyme)
MKKLFSEVLLTIKPSLKELKAELEFSRALVKYIKKKAPPRCDVVLTGSVAKRTFLRDRRDLDIFVLFDRSIPKKELEPSVKKIMASAFPSLGYQLSYAEHPYVRFHHEGRRIDLVPAYRITRSSQRISAVDRSVLHTKFILRSLKVAQRDEVLLLKQFLKASSLYGAEIKVGGFSGYLCELLVIKYQSFQKLIKAAAKWKPPLFIDIKKYYKGKKEVEKATAQFGHFTVIDPTDSKRNVAAAVSHANFLRFIKLCRRFIKKPSKDFFLRTPETFEQKTSKAAKRYSVFVITMPRPAIVDDVLWGQLQKLMRQLKGNLADFNPKSVFADDSRHLVRIAMALEKDRLPPTLTVEGPPLSMKKHVAGFKKAHKGAKFIKRKKKIWTVKKRPVVKAEAAIKQFFRAFSSSKSHLAYPEEMVVIERIK